MKRMIKEGARFSMKLELTMNLNYSSNLHIISVSHIKSRIGGTREALEEVPRGIGRVEIAKCVHEALSLSHAWQNGRRTEIVGRNKAKKRNDRSLRVL